MQRRVEVGQLPLPKCQVVLSNNPATKKWVFAFEFKCWLIEARSASKAT